MIFLHIHVPLMLNKRIFKYISLLLALAVTFCGCRSQKDLSNEYISDVSSVYSNTVSVPEPIISSCPESLPSIPSAVVESTVPSSEEAVPETVPVGEIQNEPEYSPINHQTMKACWISQFDMEKIFTSRGNQRKKSDYSSLTEKMLDNLVSYGINTIIFQVRPYGDSFYPSEYFPWSDYVTGLFGKSASYDPFQIIIDKAHERNMSVHAWINPMRGMKTEQASSLDSSYPVKQWYDNNFGAYIVPMLTGSVERIYFNPAYQEVRSLIVNGIAEIVSKYDVDGIHMDDYFYPTTDASFDNLAYSDYISSGGTESLSKFRMENINILVKNIYDTVKSIDLDVEFGISPDANIERDYEVHYADVKKWCSTDGYIDYICPQIYYGMNHENFPFDKTAKNWNSIVTAGGVKMIAGMTIGKTLTGYDQYAGESGRYEWRDNKDILKRCMESLYGLSKCCGVSLFCYQYMFNPLNGNTIPESMLEVNNFLPVLQNLSF